MTVVLDEKRDREMAATKAAYDDTLRALRVCDEELKRLEALNAELLEALKAADRFISNGIEFGYIRMPDMDTPDAAHRTPHIIRGAIAKAGELE
jgi:hypothetical protein